MNIASYIKQLGKETFVYGISSTISKFIALFLVPLYTRVFVPADYGVIAVIGSFSSFMYIVTILGLDNASARWFYDSTPEEIEKRKAIISSWFWCQILLCILMAVLVFSFASPLSDQLLDTRDYAGLLILAGISIPMMTSSRILSYWFRFQRRPWSAIIISLTSSLLTIGLTVLFVLVWRKGLSGYYWAQLLATAIMGILAVITLKSWVSPRFFSTRVLKEMLRFGLPFVPASIALWATSSSDRLILKMYLDTSEVGLYALAINFTSVITLVVTAFQMAFGPFAYSILNQPEAKLVYQKILSVYGFVGCWFSTALVLFMPYLLVILTTPQYYPAVTSVAFLAFSNVAHGTIFIGSLGSGIVKKSMPLVTSSLIGTGINIGLNFLLIPIIGRNGAAISVMVSYSFQAIFLLAVSQKLYPIPYRFLDFGVCIAVSWLLIAIDHFLLPESGIFGFLLRVGLCLLFIPVAFWLRIIKPKHVEVLWTEVQNRLTTAFNRKS